MNTPQERFCPVSSKNMEHLMGCAARASGLMYLLALATAKADEGIYDPPSDAAAEGITWLAMHTGCELKAAMDAAFAAPLGTLENPPAAPNETDSIKTHRRRFEGGVAQDGTMTAETRPETCRPLARPCKTASPSEAESQIATAGHQTIVVEFSAEEMHCIQQVAAAEGITIEALCAKAAEEMLQRQNGMEVLP